MQVKKQDWKTYEQLAARIYGKLAPDAIVKHDDLIYGHDSETERQIDVSIRKTVAGHEVLVIVQVRDRQRAPTLGDVGEFADVIRDVRASRGIMVCRKPPGKNVARLAKKRGIDMCSAFDVNDRKWSDDVTVPTIVTLTDGELLPELSFQSGSEYHICLPPKPEPDFVSLDKGKTRSTLLEYMVQLLIKCGQIQAGTHNLLSEDRDLHILLNDTDWVPVPLFGMSCTVTIRRLFRQCQMQEYLALRNYSAGELTIAEMKVELPPFHDNRAWCEAADVEIPCQVIENVPVLDLVISPRVKSTGYGMRLLPLELLEEERSLAQ